MSARTSAVCTRLCFRSCRAESWTFLWPGATVIKIIRRIWHYELSSGLAEYNVAAPVNYKVRSAVEWGGLGVGRPGRISIYGCSRDRGSAARAVDARARSPQRWRRADVPSGEIAPVWLHG